GEDERVNRLCELNVIEQVRNVCHTNIVQNAWSRGQSLSVHGWIYGLRDGLVNDLDVCVTGREDIDPIYHMSPDGQ
ncbi:MAG: carbonic anhydrase, partial [Ectothiorhodospiraceae bacterium]